MLTIEKILFPTDLSESSLQALPLATHLAELHGSDLHMFHAYVMHSLAAINDDDLYPGEGEARWALEESVAGVTWNRVVHSIGRAVHAAPAILEFANEHDIDLIVMGSHGRRGFRRLLLGSVTEEVVRLAKCPVLVIRDDPDTITPLTISRVLVPVDFSHHGSMAASYGRELASAWNANLELLHVMEPAPYADAELSFPRLTDEQEVRSFAEDHLAGIAENMGIDHPACIKVVSGYAADVIISESARADGTVIVMPSHGYRGFERVLLGSVTERVLRRAPCPVLVLRADGKELRPRSALHGMEAVVGVHTPGG
jgi:nucleotide-binding universal stress UspA family protein